MLLVRYLNFCNKWVGFNQRFLFNFSYEWRVSVPQTVKIYLAIGYL